MNRRETHLQHVTRRALERHRVVLEESDIKKILSRIFKGKYFVIKKSEKRCTSKCSVHRVGCVPTCVMVNHTNRDGMIFPLPFVYCEVKKELLTVLQWGCFEFKEYKKRLSTH
jgi:hypothetical protein